MLRSAIRTVLAAGVAGVIGVGAYATPAHAQRFWPHYYYGPPFARPVFFPRPFVYAPPPPPPTVIVERPVIAMASPPPPPVYTYSYGYRAHYRVRHVHHVVSHRPACVGSPASAVRSGS